MHNYFMYMFLSLPDCDTSFSAMEAINILEFVFSVLVKSMKFLIHIEH